jgi:hypothetical protein
MRQHDTPRATLRSVSNTVDVGSFQLFALDRLLLVIVGKAVLPLLQFIRFPLRLLGFCTLGRHPESMTQAGAERDTHVGLHAVGSTLAASLCDRVNQVACWKQCQSENGSADTHVVSDAIRLAPTHRREQVKCFADVSHDNNHQTPCADYLKKSAYSLAFEEQDERTSQQRTRWHHRDQCFNQFDMHIVTANETRRREPHPPRNRYTRA